MPRPRRSTERWRWGPPRGRDAVQVDEDGSAAIEFVLVAVVLLVPLVYLIVTLGAIQQQALGAEAGARHIARAVATAEDDGDARARTAAITGAIAAEYGMDATALEVRLECRAPATSCPQAGATVLVHVRTAVALPLVPEIWGLDRLARVPVEATAVQKVSRYRDAG